MARGRCFRVFRDNGKENILKFDYAAKRLLGHLISTRKSILVLRRHIDGGHHTRFRVRLYVAMRHPDTRFGRHKADDNGFPRTQKDGSPCKRLCYRFFIAFQYPEANMLKSQGRNTEQGINPVYMTDAQPERANAAENLGCIEEIAVAVRGHIIVGKCHEDNPAGIHQ